MCMWSTSPAARKSRITVAPPPRRFILRAPGGPVDLDRHTARGRARFDQFERPVPAGVREQPRTLADDHGEDEPAARVPAWLSVRRRRPRRPWRGRSCSVTTDRRAWSVPRTWAACSPPPRWGCLPDLSMIPPAGEDLVGSPAEHERVGALVDLVHDRRGFVVEVRPSAALE